MLIREVTDVIERFAPLAWQESYDNAGLIVGRPDDEVHRALLAVDVTDEVMAEAEREGCDMVITHHPIVFHALKRFNSADQVQRCVERAIRGGIALYACHTNLDSAPGGMSWRLAEMLGVGDLRVLQPAQADEKVGFGVVGEHRHVRSDQRDVDARSAKIDGGEHAHFGREQECFRTAPAGRSLRSSLIEHAALDQRRCRHVGFAARESRLFGEFRARNTG